MVHKQNNNLCTWYFNIIRAYGQTTNCRIGGTLVICCLTPFLGTSARLRAHFPAPNPASGEARLPPASSDVKRTRYVYVYPFTRLLRFSTACTQTRISYICTRTYLAPAVHPQVTLGSSLFVRMGTHTLETGIRTSKLGTGEAYHTKVKKKQTRGQNENIPCMSKEAPPDNKYCSTGN